MPLQNRVLPTAQIVADPARGTLTGNRGILHNDDRTLGKARWRHKAWIACALEYKGWQRKVMSPGTWTELFFLDEAVAMAAGHRPCALCRRGDYDRFRAAWQRAFGAQAKATEMDAILHASRIDPTTRGQRRFNAPLASLPAGAFVLWRDAPHLVTSDGLLPYALQGYGARIPFGEAIDDTVVLTPRPMIDVLRAGYACALHKTACG